MDGRFNAYRERNILLKELGYKSYQAYQCSALWKRIRSQVKERSGGTCECCKQRKSKNVHHKSYDRETLLGESLDQLIDLCTKCHLKIEFVFHKVGRKKFTREKRSFESAQKKLAKRSTMSHRKRKRSRRHSLSATCTQCKERAFFGRTTWRKRHIWLCKKCGGPLALDGPRPQGESLPGDPF